MADLQSVVCLLERTRRRMRLMAALEWGTTAVIPAVAGTLVVLWLWRMGLVSATTGLSSLVGLCGAVVVAASAASARPIPLHIVAHRLDKASGLSDRLGSACDFVERLQRQGAAAEIPPDTRALMAAAIEDARRLASRADPRAAVPFRLPRDTRPALGFVVVGLAVANLAFGPYRHARHPQGPVTAAGAGPQDPAGPAHGDSSEPPCCDDLEASREYLADLREIAEQTGDPSLRRFGEEMQKLLEMADKGELSKQELLARMEELEKKTLDPKSTDLEEVLSELKDSGKSLKEEPLTRRLGEALEVGDMETAKQELERLAEKLEKKELSPAEQKKLADALDKNVEVQKQLEKHQEERRRLDKELAERPQDQDTRRRLERNRRELERLERQAREQQSQTRKRQLKRLHRDLERSAENLRNRKPEQASQDMRDAADQAQEIEDEIRKLENQNKARSQLSDLKESLRRAQPRQGQGLRQRRQLSRLARIREWERRATGGPGDQRVWRPGDSGNGHAQPGRGREPDQTPGGGEPGPGIGAEHDPNLIGDPTRLAGKTRDERLSGTQGRGPSRREAILTSAKKGFAQTSYRQVYADYRKIVEEVLQNERVPQGYKFYVKRYFLRIKPHSMD